MMDSSDGLLTRADAKWPAPLSWTERHGGWVLSFCLHFMLFALLIMSRQPRTAAPAPHEVAIKVSLEEFEPAAQVTTTAGSDDEAAAPEVAPAPLSAGPAAPAPPTDSIALAAPAPAPAVTVQSGPPLVVQTPAPVEIPKPAPEPPADAAPSAVPALAPSTLPAPVSTPGPLDLVAEATAPVMIASAAPVDPAAAPQELLQGPAETRQAMRAEGERLMAESAAAGAQGSSAVASRIGVAQAGLVANQVFYGTKGHRDLFAAQGAAEGVQRDLDTSDVPDQVAQPVLDRYGIKIMLKHIDGRARQGDGFLNSARTGQGRFVRKVGRGVVRAFIFGAPAVARMAQLEEEAIHQQGLDPTRTRVTKVVFGIVPAGNGYDLGVKHIDAVPVEPPKLAPSSGTTKE